MVKGKKKIYYSHGKSSYNAGYNLGKGQLNRVANTSTTNLSNQDKLEIENDLLE
jgi:hypothetical protein